MSETKTKNILIYINGEETEPKYYDVLIHLPNGREITKRNFNPAFENELYDILYYTTKAWVDDRAALFIQLQGLEKRIKELEK